MCICGDCEDDIGVCETLSTLDFTLKGNIHGTIQDTVFSVLSFRGWCCDGASYLGRSDPIARCGWCPATCKHTSHIPTVPDGLENDEMCRHYYTTIFTPFGILQPKLSLLSLLR